MPTDWVLRRGKLVGVLTWQLEYGKPTYLAMLTDASGRELAQPLSLAKRCDHPDGRVKITGIQMAGSTSPKSKRWSLERQIWLCKPLTA